MFLSRIDLLQSFFNEILLVVTKRIRFLMLTAARTKLLGGGGTLTVFKAGALGGGGTSIMTAYA